MDEDEWEDPLRFAKGVALGIALSLVCWGLILIPLWWWLWG